ncbi:MAG: hypothetical protein B6247_26895 [Candidatus Parabeggiatoa sp. nov. 2]|nr:MAG: hypothetical protein B6247_26895 [Beggiatoa sp. 4572_84]
MSIHRKVLACCIMTIVLTFISLSVSAETELPPLTKKYLGKLFSRGDLNVVKIFLQHPGEVAQIESTGVVIQTIEPDYVVIVGDSQRIEKVRRMGFTLVEPVEKDHKIRPFRVLISMERCHGDGIRVVEWKCVKYRAFLTDLPDYK